MRTNQLNCASCGALITVPDHREFINCPYCAAILAIIRGEGYTAFKVIESITKSLPTLDDLTHETGPLSPLSKPNAEPVSEEQQIREQIQMAEMQLANLMAEIDAIERVQGLTSKDQSIRRLYAQEFQILESLRTLNQSLAALGPQDIESRIAALEGEVDWISAQLQALDSASDGESEEAGSIWETTSDRMRAYRRKLLIKISDLNMEKIKEPLASFKVKEASLHDRAAIDALMATIRADQDRVAKMTQTLEVSLVRDELTARYQALVKAKAAFTPTPERTQMQQLVIPVSSGEGGGKSQPTGLKALFNRKK